MFAHPMTWRSALAQPAAFCSPGPFHLPPALLIVLTFAEFPSSDFISYFWLWICPLDLMTRFCSSRIMLNPCHTSPNIVLYSPSGSIPSQLLWVNTLLKSFQLGEPGQRLASLPPHPHWEKNQTSKALTIHDFIEQNGTCFLLKVYDSKGGKIRVT